MGQERGDAHACNRQEKAESQDAYQRLPKDGAGAAEVIGPHQVRHLHGKAAGDGHAKAAKKPQTSGNQADRGPGGRPQMPHHGGVDILHHHG